jgi:hypothetical protein
MYTRQNYLEKICTHSQYYSQFIVNPEFLTYVANFIGIKNLESSVSPNFNDIDLRYWDVISPPTGTSAKMKSLGDSLTLSGCVCIAKEAAREFLLTKKEITL